MVSIKPLYVHSHPFYDCNCLVFLRWSGLHVSYFDSSCVQFNCKTNSNSDVIVCFYTILIHVPYLFPLPHSHYHCNQHIGFIYQPVSGSLCTLNWSSKTINRGINYFQLGLLSLIYWWHLVICFLLSRQSSKGNNKLTMKDRKKEKGGGVGVIKQTPCLQQISCMGLY